MIYTYKHDSVTWIDLENPTRDEVRNLVEEYDIDLTIAEELLNPSSRSRVDLHKDYIYLILHFPVQFHEKDSHTRHKIEEVDFIIGKKFIITTRYSSIDALLEFSKIFEADLLREKKQVTQHAGFVFYHMIKNIYKSLYEKVGNLKSTLSAYEDQIFLGHEKEMVFALSKMNRTILYFKEALILHKEILHSFEYAAKKLFEEEFSYYLRAVIGEYSKVEHALVSTKEYLSELRQTNDSLLSNKQNEISKNLTIMASILLPLSFITGLFGMNAEYMPIVGQSHDFWIIVGIMSITLLTMFLIFKRKKLL